MNYKAEHTFHIPVMGTGFSIDTPIKVAKYGISSVISLVDDSLIEEMRKFYCAKYKEEYQPITKYDADYRARRITEYLNLVDRIVKIEFDKVKHSPFEPGSEISKYFEMLPDSSELKGCYRSMLNLPEGPEKESAKKQLRDDMVVGEINVNIMTKLDRNNFAVKGGVQLPIEFSDALSALRGYARSSLQSAIVFSAGINQRLYSYVEEFKDFYADATGFIKKKIILKVSDYRSSLIQGKFFAKKGLWVSEYRVESGLNCGGHAFATNGFLMGPILNEFKQKRQELIDSLQKVYEEALRLKERIQQNNVLPVRVTAQGGIGTATEDKFLRDEYQLDGTGWGTPFLLCPDATNVEDTTLQKLSAAGEKDLYLSDVSPLGVPFNNLRANDCELERDRRVSIGKPGSPCPKGHLVSNTEFTEKPICTASRQYQKLKVDELQVKGLSECEYKAAYERITVKACICNDLGEGVLIKNNVPKNGKRFSAVCPGPNLAYFSKIVSLPEIVSHIYGRVSILNDTYRPHMFIKELRLYVDYLRREIVKQAPGLTEKQQKYFTEFRNNLLEGIKYYHELFPRMLAQSKEYHEKSIHELEHLRKRLDDLIEEFSEAFHPEARLVSTASK